MLDVKDAVHVDPALVLSSATKQTRLLPVRTYSEAE